MLVTKQLRKWLVDQCDVQADADDAVIKQAAASALVEGKLTAEKLAELQKDPEAEEAAGFVKSMGEFMKRSDDRFAALEAKLTAGAPAEAKADAGTDGSDAKLKATAPTAPAVDDKAAHSDDTQLGQVRVKGAHENYATTRKSMHFPDRTDKNRPHAKSGQQLAEGGTRGTRPIEGNSELDNAICGAYFKWSLHCGTRGGAGVPAAMRMNDHDTDLINYALRNCKWAGVIGGEGSEGDHTISVKNEKLSERGIKAVLDDATSGGVEVAPIMFDDAIISTPLLNGEFFPSVNVINVTRGRRIEGGSIGNVTLTSGGADGTAIPLFTTTGYIAAFDTTIFTVNGAIELGLDFLSDAVPDIGAMVIGQYGQQLLTWLDNQICNGDGTTEPEGILVASGTQSVGSTNGAGGPPTVGDYEGLLFGVAKEYKTGWPSNRVMFGANETTYQRARSIAVGSSDQRRVFGMTHEDYMLLGHPYGIQGSIANARLFYGVMPRYRMYRRLGLTIKTSTEGKELVRDNMMLITARARFGGQIEDGAAFAVMTDAQS